jgi:hypothetical protein
MMETQGIATGASASAPVTKKCRITWDEETIEEHDKLRGTRQIIDEPPTPFHYTTLSGSTDDNDEHAGTSMHSADESEGDNLNSDKPTRQRGSSFNMAANTPGGGIKGDSMSIFDNWEGLNAKLTFHQMHQGEESELKQDPPSSSHPHSHPHHKPVKGVLAFRTVDDAAAADEDAMDVDGSTSASAVSIPAPDPHVSSVLKSTSRWSSKAQPQPQSHPSFAVPVGAAGQVHHPHTHAHHTRPDDSSGEGAGEGEGEGDSEGGDGGDGGEGGEGGVHESREEAAFKSKRAAHYNEFKLIQAMRAKQLQEEEDEEEEGEGMN